MAYFAIEKSEINGQFYFRFSATNSEQILASEGYKSKQECREGIDALKGVAPYDHYYKRSDSYANYRFNVVARNGEIVARSSEGYSTSYNREHAIGLVKSDAPTAVVYDWTV